MADQLDQFVQSKSAAKPTIYAYTDSHYPGKMKVGYTAGDVQRRIDEQYPLVLPYGKPYTIVFQESAMYEDGSTFGDHELHHVMRMRGIPHTAGEWFECELDQLKAAYYALKLHQENLENRTQVFTMRPEQKAAVKNTMRYYHSAKQDRPNRAPKFLWNAKMRFGKTFAAYQLAKAMGMQRVLILTFKPAVESAWSEDLMTHMDFEGWQFISSPMTLSDHQVDVQYEKADRARPIVCFGSFQDMLGVNRETGGIKAKHKWMYEINWDLIIFDEYHFGAWRDNARKLFENEDDDSYDTLDVEQYKKEEADNAFNETWIPLTTKHYLYLSGTPFRALNTGEFSEEQIFSWTYGDEQRAKAAWGDMPDNPYAAMPRMVMLTYKLPEELQRVALQGEFNEFDLNVFFKADGQGSKARFTYENEVQKWLDLMRGAYQPTSTDELKLGRGKPAMPYSDTRLLNVLGHTFWFLPNVAACYAMHNLLRQPMNNYYHDYHINICAGIAAGIGLDALGPVQASMKEPLKSKSITLSCGKLTTGVTVRPWTGIFMLRNLTSPETYFQAAFRVQSPWEVETDGGKREIMKRDCYVFDFALNRALRQVSDYSRGLNVKETNPEKQVGEFVSFLPVLAYDGGTMRQIDAGEVLDIAMSGTSGTMLARRWESALLVNVDNETLARLMASKEAMTALMSIEGFRSLNADIETIINKSEAVKKARKDPDKPLTEKEKKTLTQEEKEYKSKRKEIQEKLIKFATRIPIFMYLTDYREHSLEDVITQLEPGLFKKVTGMDVKDFNLLLSLNVFNRSLMNDSVYKFKRYEDASLSYTGIDLHAGERVGGFDTSISREDYERMFRSQQETLSAPAVMMGEAPPIVFDVEADEDIQEVEARPAATHTGKKPDPLHIVTTAPVSAHMPHKVSIPSSVTTRKHGADYFGGTPVITPAAKPSKPAGPDPRALPGAAVVHKVFGPGTIVAISKDHVSVQFEGGTKEFQNPGAFATGFLQFA